MPPLSLTSLRFPRAERLKSRKCLQSLVDAGTASFLYPYRIFWDLRPSATEPAYPVQVAFAVPKRRFRHAVDRNRIRRRMREAWRLHRQDLIDQVRESGQALSCLLIYAGKPEDSDYARLEKGMVRLLGGLRQGNLPPAKPAGPARSRKGPDR